VPAGSKKNKLVVDIDGAHGAFTGDVGLCG